MNKLYRVDTEIFSRILQSSEQQPAENKQGVGSLDLKDPATPSQASENPRTHTGTGDGEHNEMNESQIDEKVMKKPDKKIPCPRCDSANTMFCYYNNYNPNQPRHFCRECQRYWTAGGTMRNVPVGSGRRKSKSSSSSRSCPDVIFGASQIPDYRNHGTILSFGSGFPFLDLLGRAKFCLQNGVQSRGMEIGEDSSSISSSVTASSSSEKRMGNKGPMDQDSQGFHRQAPFLSAAHSGLPVSFYRPPSAWDCTTSLTLGKHTRDGKILNPYLRSTIKSEEIMRLGEENNPRKESGRNYESMNSKGPFRAFRPNAAGEACIRGMSSVLQANPAALSRSMNFRECS